LQGSSGLRGLIGNGAALDPQTTYEMRENGVSPGKQALTRDVVVQLMLESHEFARGNVDENVDS
jgi:hypothetical protein